MQLYTQTHTNVNTHSLLTVNNTRRYYLRMTLAERLKTKMEEKKLNAYSLSKLCFVPQPTISRIMNGQHLEPRRSTLAPIAAILGISVEELTNGETDKTISIEFSTVYSGINEEGKAFLRSALKVARIQYGHEQKDMIKKG